MIGIFHLYETKRPKDIKIAERRPETNRDDVQNVLIFLFPLLSTDLLNLQGGNDMKLT